MRNFLNFFLALAFLFTAFNFIFPITAQAVLLTDLPFGTVISIPTTDTYMCNDITNCTATTSEVLPYKFVKMQARDDAGNPVTSTNTYWAFLDNYCWWGSANCRYYDGTRSSRYSSWNANSMSDYTNNISIPQAYNIMNTMGNFYASLPTMIGGMDKTTAIPDYAWEMRQVSNISGTTTPTKSGCTPNWTPSTQTFSGMSATFSDILDCTMTTKVATLSYDEWQGGLASAGYAAFPIAAGSGQSYCQARFGLNCTGGSGTSGIGAYTLFNDASTANGQASVATTLASNPRPRSPWLRSPLASNTGTEWYISGSSAMYSVNWYYTYVNFGALPAFWLSSQISIDPASGVGTYASPYSLAEEPDPCDDPANASLLSCLPMGSVIQIQGTDTTVCADISCTTTSTNVPSYKFVKMQARDSAGNPQTNLNDVNATYWAMLDNYCWWGSAQCNSGSSISANSVMWGSLTQYSNLYNSLPPTIGGLPKYSAFVDQPWDMLSVDFTSGTGPTTVGDCSPEWQTGTQTIGDLSFVFSDPNSCTMTSKFAQLSYTDWQGGLYGYSRFPTINELGSGYSFCQARWNTDCTNNNAFGLFTQGTIQFSPYEPWLRNDRYDNYDRAYIISGATADFSVSSENINNASGLTPVFWLSSELTFDSTSGTGTYASPYNLAEPDPCTDPANANLLSCLPMGSVIQIQGTDTYMCNDTTNCTTTSNVVLPYKFVKMQARNDSGNPVTSENTYWALLDNYCWWGSANCRYYDNTLQSRYASWNANSIISYTNNMSIPQTYNIMNTLGNFYSSLPATIGGLDKNTAIPDYAWEMRPVSNVADAGTPVKSGCTANWAANTYSFSNMPATFSDPTNCTMSTKVAMLSYDEWQGGLTSAGYGTYPTTSGSGYSYCQGRFGLNCTGGTDTTGIGAYGLFNDTSTANGQTVASASNPRPNYPWLRSPYATNTLYVWQVDSTPATRSVYWTYANGNRGVLPALWLSSALEIAPNSGANPGTYANPYQLAGDLPEITLSNADVSQTLSSEDSFTLTGTVQTPNLGDTLIVSATITTSTGELTKTQVLTSGPDPVTYSLTWTAAELGDGYTNYDSETGTPTPITITATNSSGGEAQVQYTGTLTVDFTPRLTMSLTNPDANRMAQIEEGITFSGLFSATNSANVAQDVLITANINGVDKTFTQAIPPTTEVWNQGWALSWSADEVPAGVYFGPSAPLAITGTINAQQQVVAFYTGYLTFGVEPLTPESLSLLASLPDLLSVRFAGTLHLPLGTSPQSQDYPDTSDYVYSSTLDDYHQIWTKSLVNGLTYPFLVEYFDLPPDQGSITGWDFGTPTPTPTPAPGL